MFEKVCDNIAGMLSFMIGIIFLSLFLIVSAEIFSRYILDQSIRGAYELSRYLVIWMVFLGTSLGVRRFELTSINFIKERFSENGQQVIGIVGITLMICLIGISVVEGTRMLQVAGKQHSAGLGMNMAIPYLAIPVGSCFILIFLFEGLLKIVRQVGGNK